MNGCNCLLAGVIAEELVDLQILWSGWAVRNALEAVVLTKKIQMSI